MVVRDGVEQREQEQPLSGLYDDTEEMLVGADWHQLAIGQIAFGLRDLARRHALPWHVGNQLTLSGPRGNGTIWRPSPDISLHTSAGPELRTDLDIVAEGPPALLIEVLSPTTWRHDLIRSEGLHNKPYGYLEVWKVAEYLIFDPHEEHLVGQCRGWRRVGDRVEEWHPTAHGHYQSRLGMSFAPENIFLRLYDFDGRSVAFDVEQAERRVGADRRAEAAERARVEADRRAEAAERARVEADRRAEAAERARVEADRQAEAERVRAETLEALLRQVRGDDC